MCLVRKLDCCSWSKVQSVSPCELVEVAYVVSICAFAATALGRADDLVAEHRHVRHLHVASGVVCFSIFFLDFCLAYEWG
jgi:hypothetical protein